MSPQKTSFQFISEPSDVNFGGKVHGGSVMKWIDQAAYTCARDLVRKLMRDGLCRWHPVLQTDQYQ